MRLKDRTAIVTGAASGIGKAIAIRFAEEGANVIVADRTDAPREGGEKTLDLILAAGGSAEFAEMDVADWASVDATVGAVVSTYGALDIMVNNAAIGVGKPLLETSEEDWDRVMSVNAKGVFFGCKRAVQQMLTQPARDGVRGRIVNISSQHGMVRSPNDLAYGTGKAAVVYMTRQIAGDYAAEGIVCNAVAPGKILTGKTGRAVDSDILAYSEARTPWPRLGRPLDVANAVLFLASDEATYITGENLMVDGGWMAN
ncbi:SDR family NAD(P)-dependent oxidoreductase [Nisaea sediminum]|uniref:SDR family NAD(P)-dependent oxidoreductase n=1 Tax=Nisaea sediminum TaxID=2775867 RepID=UPI001867E770|nr:glucose 1-dehydrogenase [Nisaea sediminum]